jgi:hypothetical protein
MYYWLKRNIDILLINILTLVMIVIFYYNFNIAKEILAAIFGIGISLSIGILQYKIENDKIFKELFKEFTIKYDIKFNDKLNEIDISFKNNNNYKIKNEDIPLIIDYLNFCSEEYLWYIKGRISENVWESWENGMLYFLNLGPINQIVQTQKGQKSSYYGLFSKIEKRLKIIN